jgi:hypothetical protein
MMSDVNAQALELAQTQLNNYKKVTEQELGLGDYPAPVCVIGDKECVNRWIAAFGDCA